MAAMLRDVMDRGRFVVPVETRGSTTTVRVYWSERGDLRFLRFGGLAQVPTALIGDERCGYAQDVSVCEQAPRRRYGRER